MKLANVIDDSSTCLMECLNVSIPNRIQDIWIQLNVSVKLLITVS